MVKLLPLLLVVSLFGCRSKKAEDGPLLHMDGARQVGASVQGRPIECLVMGDGPDHTMIIATIHGNENAGTPLVHKLVERLKSYPSLLEGRQLILVPVVNPDGYVANTRGNANGIDLNRNFGSSNRENNKRYGVTELSEPESKVIAKLLEQHKPTRIVSIHQPLNCIDHDGPAEAIARHMAKYGPLRVRKLGSRPGSLGSYAGVDLKIPIITYELPRDVQKLPADHLWLTYGASLAASLLYPDPVPDSLRRTELNRWYLALILGVSAIVMGGITYVIIRRHRRTLAKQREQAMPDGIG